MRRKSAKQLTLLFSLTFAQMAMAEDLADKQARIGTVTGDVGFLSQGAPEWVEARDGLPLESGDQIKTGEDGKIELIVGEYALWTLEPETLFAVDHLQANSGRFHLSSGTLLGSVDSAAAIGKPQVWELNTPVAVVAIRGTEFALSFSKEEGSRLGVFEGEVEMQQAETASGPGEIARVRAGEEFLAPRGKPMRRLKEFSRPMQHYSNTRVRMRRRHQAIRGTWTAYTPSVRTDLRKKFVAPPPKRLQRPPRQFQKRPVSSQKQQRRKPQQ